MNKKLYFLATSLLLLIANITFANIAFNVKSLINNHTEIQLQINVNVPQTTAKLSEYKKDNGEIYLVLTGYQQSFPPTHKEIIHPSHNHPLVSELTIRSVEDQPNQVSIKIVPKSPISYLTYQTNNQLFFDLSAQETNNQFTLNMNDQRNKFFDHLNQSAPFSVILKAKRNSDTVAFIAKDFSIKKSISLMAKWHQWNVYPYKNFILLSEQKITPSRSLKPIKQKTDDITMSFANISSHTIISFIADFANIRTYSYKDGNVTVYVKKEPWGDILEAIAILDGVSMISQPGGVYFGE